ncbi:MAG: hypothetical protein IKL68_06655 [Clostridia bacterium]|nr:hypothetical protein [Clostridia bacterium]
MEKKNKYLKLCLDPELEKESKKVQKGAIIISMAFSAVAIAVILIMVCLLT